MSSLQPQLQPPPPSFPKQDKSRWSSAEVGTVIKCSLKSQTASTKSRSKTEDGSDTTTKAVMVLRDEQKPQEPSPTCTVVQPTKNKRTVNDQETHPDGKGDHTNLISGKDLEVQQKKEDMILGIGQEQIPGVSYDGASHSNKLEVRNGFLLK